MRAGLRWLVLAAGCIALAAGVAVALSLDTPLQVVAPLLSVLAAIGAVLVVLAASAWLLQLRPPALAFGLAGGLALSLATALALSRPSCNPFDVANGEVRLAGTACLPASGPSPTAIFVHGSGRMPRDEYRYYAERLARRGIAAVIYDKRGAGKSTGNTYAVGYEGYAGDLAAVAAWTREQSFSRDDAVGFVGYSEAEWVMPIAARAANPAFIVLVGGSGLSPLAQVSEEIELRLRAAGFAEEDVAAAAALNRRLGEYIAGRASAEAFGKELAVAKARPWFRVAEELPGEVHPREQYEWWARVMEFDATAAWAGYRGPVLFLKGTADDRSDAGRAAARFRRMVGEGADLTVRLFEDADHALLRWPLGRGRPPPAFAPGYPRLMADWILERVTARDRRSTSASRP